MDRVTTPAVPRNRRNPLLLLAAAAGIAIIIVVTVILATRSTIGGQYDVVDGAVTVGLATVTPYGDVLVTNQGYPLYMFPPDEQQKVACTGECAVTWPPLYLPEGTKLVAGPGVDATLLGSVTAPDGQVVASYDGWPLYTYLGDITPKVATGQGQYLDGGYWYLIHSNGELVKPSPAG